MILDPALGEDLAAGVDSIAGLPLRVRAAGREAVVGSTATRCRMLGEALEVEGIGSVERRWLGRDATVADANAPEEHHPQAQPGRYSWHRNSLGCRPEEANDSDVRSWLKSLETAVRNKAAMYECYVCRCK